MFLRYGKRAFDVFFAMIAIIALYPLMLLTSTLIFLEDGRPVVFRQRRVGANGVSFVLFKFRSMPVETASISSEKAGNLKITRVGGIIRRTNIDEIPQLFNILRGDMSIVGPRPALPSQDGLVEIRKTNGSSRLRPGLTGLAQINSYDGMTPSAKAEYDGRYVSQITLLGDLGIILRTFGYLLSRPPVY